MALGGKAQGYIRIDLRGKRLASRELHNCNQSVERRNIAVWCGEWCGEMGYDLENILAEQREIVREIFVNTADDNYIAARWCFTVRLNVDFYWLAVHALEKYMKAVLLLNGRSGIKFQEGAGRRQNFGHDITVLYEQVKGIAADFLPEHLEKMDPSEIEYWRDETPEACLRRFYLNGNADNRYHIFGLVRLREDLFKLDLLVYALRRLCIPLDAYYPVRRERGGTSVRYRDMLTEQSKYWALISHCKLVETATGKRGNVLRDVFLNMNLPFAPDDYEHRDLSSGMKSATPVLARSVLRPLERPVNGDAAARAVQVCDWVLGNIKLPRDVKDELKEARDRCME